MQITLSNGKQYVIKVQYNTKFRQTIAKDEYGREVVTSWDEVTTEVAVHEWTPDIYDSKIIVKGLAHCSYKDQFSRKVGKLLAYYNAVTTMLENGLISPTEAEEFDLFNLDKARFDVKTEKKAALQRKPDFAERRVNKILNDRNYTSAQSKADGTLRVAVFAKTKRARA